MATPRLHPPTPFPAAGPSAPPATSGVEGSYQGQAITGRDLLQFMLTQQQQQNQQVTAPVVEGFRAIALALATRQVTQAVQAAQTRSFQPSPLQLVPKGQQQLLITAGAQGSGATVAEGGGDSGAHGTPSAARAPSDTRQQQPTPAQQPTAETAPLATGATAGVTKKRKTPEIGEANPQSGKRVMGGEGVGRRAGLRGAKSGAPEKGKAPGEAEAAAKVSAEEQQKALEKIRELTKGLGGDIGAAFMKTLEQQEASAAAAAAEGGEKEPETDEERAERLNQEHLESRLEGIARYENHPDILQMGKTPHESIGLSTFPLVSHSTRGDAWQVKYKSKIIARVKYNTRFDLKPLLDAAEAKRAYYYKKGETPHSKDIYIKPEVLAILDDCPDETVDLLVERGRWAQWRDWKRVSEELKAAEVAGAKGKGRGKGKGK